MDFDPLNTKQVSEFSLDPTISPSLGKKCEFLEVSGFVKVTIIRGKVNKTKKKDS